MAQVLWVGVGGFLGSILRYLLGTFISKSWMSAIPLGTLTVNLLGSFIIGMALAFVSAKPNPDWYYFVVPGILGGFTTYSAFAGETVLLLQKNLYQQALLYIALTLLGGILFCALGFWILKT